MQFPKSIRLRFELLSVSIKDFPENQQAAAKDLEAADERLTGVSNELSKLRRRAEDARSLTLKHNKEQSSAGLSMQAQVKLRTWQRDLFEEKHSRAAAFAKAWQLYSELQAMSSSDAPAEESRVLSQWEELRTVLVQIESEELGLWKDTDASKSTADVIWLELLRRHKIDLHSGSPRVRQTAALNEDLEAVGQLRLLAGELIPDCDQTLKTITDERDEELWNLLLELNLNALCFSGGGIRSATFGLGILQGMAHCSYDGKGDNVSGLLTEFDYLSTVSGGGYLGSWLTRWICHIRGHQKVSSSDAYSRVIAELAKQRPIPLDPEPLPVRRLRDYSKYLAPRAGLISPDSWTLLTTYLRNLLLNWIILLPFAMACIASVFLLQELCVIWSADWTILSGEILRTGVAAQQLPLLSWRYWVEAIGADSPSNVLLVEAGRLSTVAVFMIVMLLPVNATRWRQKFRVKREFLEGALKGAFWVQFGLLFLSAVLLGCWGLMQIPITKFADSPSVSEALLLRAVPYFFAASASAFFALAVGRCSVLWFAKPYWPWWQRFLEYATAHIFSAIITVVGFTELVRHVWPRLISFSNSQTGDPLDVRPFIILAVPTVILVYLAALSILSGLLSQYEEEEDREWLARTGAYWFIFCSGWITGTFLVLYSKEIIAGLVPLSLSSHDVRNVSLVTLAMGAIASWLGFSPATASGKSQPNFEQLSGVGKFLAKRHLLLPIVGSTFFALLIVCLSQLVMLLKSGLLPGVPTTIVQPQSHDFLTLARRLLLPEQEWSALLSIALVTGMVALLAQFYVNVNTFSMHGLYRSRLIRAYLGASNENREQAPMFDRFTGFDSEDNVDMQEAPAEEGCPLHVINSALNLVATRKLSWQERKAESFITTALSSGSDQVGYQATKTYAGRRGITLGTAMTISGAAASPNAGYHSSPIITLLMAFFNVRLGWWLPNPGRAGKRFHHQTSPSASLRPLLFEASGITNDTSRWIYVSDGGHFENLGIYEMVRRRCRTIVAIDASADPKFTLEDLGNAVRKVRIDFGIPIQLKKNETIHLHPGAADENRHCVVFDIRYDLLHKNQLPGTLIYIKASLCSRVSQDISHYASEHPSFPHESTVDQFFNESEFESYRRLGYQTIEHILDADLHKISLQEFAEKARQHGTGEMPVKPEAFIVEKFTSLLQSGTMEIKLRQGPS